MTRDEKLRKIQSLIGDVLIALNISQDNLTLLDFLGITYFPEPSIDNGIPEDILFHIKESLIVGDPISPRLLSSVDKDLEMVFEEEEKIRDELNNAYRDESKYDKLYDEYRKYAMYVLRCLKNHLKEITVEIQALVVDVGMLKVEDAEFITYKNLFSPLSDEAQERLAVIKKRAELLLDSRTPEKDRTASPNKEVSKEPDTPVTLFEFMTEYCKPISENRCISHAKSLQSGSRRNNAKFHLPPHVGKWKQGQSKKYSPSALKEKWPEYREINPSLPELK